jgi:hypothetical protein
MGWGDSGITKKEKQVHLPVGLNEEELKLFTCFQKCNEMHLDELVLNSELSIGKLAPVLLSLEMKNIIAAKPGKKFCLM